MKKLFYALCALSLAVGPVAIAPAPLLAQSGPAVKMSRNGICHPRGGTYYGRTIHYTPYPSMAACIRAGGRAPRR